MIELIELILAADLLDNLAGEMAAPSRSPQPGSGAGCAGHRGRAPAPPRRGWLSVRRPTGQSGKHQDSTGPAKTAQGYKAEHERISAAGGRPPRLQKPAFCPIRLRAN